jgi:AcrR family transcriptional regulator
VTHAERLVAERGFRGVAASEVVRAAGQKNNSAIAYHFGSWDGLLDAIWERHTVSINESRGELLERAGSNGPAELATLVGIYVDPIVSEMARNEPSYWARFNEQWLACAPLNVFEPGTPAPGAQAHNPDPESVAALTKLLNQLVEKVPHLPPDERTRRVALMARFVIGGLAAWERDAQAQRQDLEEFGGELVTLAVALLQAPASSR